MDWALGSVRTNEGKLTFGSWYKSVGSYIVVCFVLGMRLRLGTFSDSNEYMWRGVIVIPISIS